MKLARKDLELQLQDWYSGNSKEALLVMGLPMTGKTALVKDWLKESQLDFLYLDEKTYSSIKDIFDNSNENIDFILELANRLSIPLPKDKVIVFDGVCPKDELLVRIKQICSHSSNRFILISDYGEAVLDNLRFYPIGSLRQLMVYPLSFKEFCMNRISPLAIELVEKAMAKEDKYILPYADSFERLWNDYSVYGGFPSVISELYENGQIAALNELNQIKDYFIQFIKENIKFSKSLLLILSHLKDQRSVVYHRFVFSQVRTGYTYQKAQKGLSQLSRLGLLNVVKFKNSQDYVDLYFCDPGLETIFLGKASDRRRLIETAVAQYGKRHNKALYRLASDSRIEFDFVFDDSCFFDIRLKPTRGIDSSVQRLEAEAGKKSSGFGYLLFDYGINYSLKTVYTAISPIWGYLLSKE